MDSNMSLHLKIFNDKIKLMNQSQSRDLTLSAQEARNIHADVFALLAQIAELSKKPQSNEEIVQISMDGGGFK
jgi:peptidoglycan hydrolase CwlO-like protein